MAVNKENLNKLYEKVINDVKLTTNELNSCGLNSSDIKKLIVLGKLERIERGYYTFLSFDDLYDYGIKKIKRKNYEKAFDCFEKCYQLNPNDNYTCFQLFVKNIRLKDYNKALKYFEVFSKDLDFCCDQDYNLYIYLLNMVTELPDEYKKYIKKLDKYYIMLFGYKPNYATASDTIRREILKNKFNSALVLMRKNVYFGDIHHIACFRILTYQASEMYKLVQNGNMSISQTHAIAKNPDDEIKEFLNNKYEFLLENKGVILLKPMDDERIRKIHELVEKYPDMVSFDVGNEKNRKIVLRYQPYETTYFDIRELLKEGTNAYKEGKYDDCINIYMRLLQIKSPRTFIYSQIGLAYMKKNQLDLAIQYLTIATELSKEEDGRWDFSELIDSLKGKVGTTRDETYFVTNEKEYKNDLYEKYGIENFDEITSYILNSGVDVESACLQLGIEGEQIDIIRLIYAKTYYSQGDYDKGDQFIKKVEKSKNKSNFVLKLFEEVKRNKNFYINRKDKNFKNLSLKIIP